MPTNGPHPIAIAIRGPISCTYLLALFEQVHMLVAKSEASVIMCEVAGVVPDAVTVDALARLQLAARRRRCSLLLCDASDELLELVKFMGLENVLPDSAMSSRHSGRPRTDNVDEEEKMTSTGARKMFVNLAVEDLDRSVEFFTKLGFAFDPGFTDESATCMLVGEDAYVMLLVEKRFRDFTTKELADTATHTEAIVALSAASRAEVDELADRALAAGGSPANEPMEMDFMYGRSFQDPDGHVWELFWMDPTAIPK